MSQRDPMQIKAACRRKAQRLACPWEPDSPERLSAREFLSLVGVKDKNNDYRRATAWLAMVVVGDHNERIPARLKEPFRDGVPRVHAFKGHGPVSVRPMCFRRVWSDNEPGTVFERRRLLVMTHHPLLSTPRGPGS